MCSVWLWRVKFSNEYEAFGKVVQSLGIRNISHYNNNIKDDINSLFKTIKNNVHFNLIFLNIFNLTMWNYGFRSIQN